MAGDKPYGERKVEVCHSEMNLLSVGGHGDAHAHETMKIRDQQHELSREIAKAQERCMHVAGKLAAYYPNGHYGVIENMPHGPAKDLIQEHIHRQV